MKISVKIVENHARETLMQSPKEMNFVDKVRLVIKQKLGQQKAFKDIVSDQLDLHPKDLQRRLEQEGTSFRELLSDVRFEMAKKHLVTSEVSLSQLSAFLGYRDVSSFSRAFKNKHAMSPATWRKNNR